MSRVLSTSLLTQLYSQESDDPFVALVTLYHSNFGYIRIVNNSEDIISNGNTFTSFPFSFVMPPDDGETARTVAIEFDNISLELIEEIRGATDYIDVTIELVLASAPDTVEIELGELRIRTLTYNQTSIRAELFMDDFLNTEMTSEKYTPTNFPGIFT